MKEHIISLLYFDLSLFLSLHFILEYNPVFIDRQVENTIRYKYFAEVG